MLLLVSGFQGLPSLLAYLGEHLECQRAEPDKSPCNMTRFAEAIISASAIRTQFYNVQYFVVYKYVGPAIADNLNCELRFCSLLFAAFFLVGASALPRALMLGSVRSVCTRGQQKSGRLYGLARKCGEKF